MMQKVVKTTLSVRSGIFFFFSMRSSIQDQTKWKGVFKCMQVVKKLMCQGNVREIENFLRSGNCQGIL